MNKGIQIQDLKFIPASFEKNEKADSLGVTVVLELLVKSIKDQKQITLYDIRCAHADYSMKRQMHRAGWMWEVVDGEKKWTKAKTKEEWLKCWSSQYKAIPWFKMNLGAAIIKGKLLVVPVIKIEDTNLLPNELLDERSVASKAE